MKSYDDYILKQRERFRLYKRQKRRILAFYDYLADLEAALRMALFLSFTAILLSSVGMFTLHLDKNE